MKTPDNPQEETPAKPQGETPAKPQGETPAKRKETAAFYRSLLTVLPDLPALAGC